MMKIKILFIILMVCGLLSGCTSFNQLSRFDVASQAGTYHGKKVRQVISRLEANLELATNATNEHIEKDASLRKYFSNGKKLQPISHKVEQASNASVQINLTVRHGPKLLFNSGVYTVRQTSEQVAIVKAWLQAQLDFIRNAADELDVDAEKIDISFIGSTDSVPITRRLTYHNQFGKIVVRKNKVKLNGRPSATDLRIVGGAHVSTNRDLALLRAKSYEHIVSKVLANSPLSAIEPKWILRTNSGASAGETKNLRYSTMIINFNLGSIQDI